MTSTRPAQRGDPFAILPRPARAAAAGAMLIVLCAYAYSAPEWELLSGKHYWDRGYHYGGYALQYLPTWDGFRAIHLEGQANVENLDPLTESGPWPWPKLVDGFPGTERLFAPFVAAIVIRTSWGRLDIPDAYRIVNLAAWLLTIIMAYRLATLYFGDGWAPPIAALLCATYPAFTLTLGSLKVQALGTAYLLVGIFIFERSLKHSGIVMQFLGLLGAMWLGLFASGGWVFLCIYIVIRQAWGTGWRRWIPVLALIAAIVLARWGLTLLSAKYHLPSVEQTLHISYSQIVVESVEWLRTLLAGGDLSSRKLLNYPGYRLFQHLLPTLVLSFVRGHFVLILTSAAACVMIPRTRMLVVMAVAMFFAGHVGTMLTGWEWHYGYLSAPAGIMLILATSGVLATLAADRSRWSRAIGAVALVLILSPWFDLKTHAGLYWGGVQRYGTHVQVHFEGAERPRVY